MSAACPFVRATVGGRGDQRVTWKQMLASDPNSPLPGPGAAAEMLDAIFTPVVRHFVDTLPADPADWLARRTATPHWVEHPHSDANAVVEFYDVAVLRRVMRTLNVVSPEGLADNPISAGAYGATAAEAIACAAQALADIWAQWWEQGRHHVCAHLPAELITAATFWGASGLNEEPDAPAETIVAAAIRRTVHDGIASVAQGLAHLSFDVVPGYDNDFLGLLRAMAAAGMLDDLALRMSLNTLGPMSVQGRTFPMPPLQVDGCGEIMLSEALIEWLHREKRLKLRVVRETPEWERRHDGTVAAGAGCPVALGRTRHERTVIADLTAVMVDGVAALLTTPERVAHRAVTGRRSENAARAQGGSPAA